MARRRPPTRLPAPFLRRVWLPDDLDLPEETVRSYPFCLPLFQTGFEITFDKAVTIIVGENGSGKSTILEAIATMAGFSEGGGATGMGAVPESLASGRDGGAVGEMLRASWLPQMKTGWFFRAETFFTVARYLDEAGSPNAGFLRASHGEGFLSFFEERMQVQGLFILDEPEAALSPSKQFEFLKLLRQMQRAGNCQVIIATHSPFLMALPDADLWQVSTYGLQPTRLEDTIHFKMYEEFVRFPHDMVEAMTE